MCLQLQFPRSVSHELMDDVFSFPWLRVCRLWSSEWWHRVVWYVHTITEEHTGGNWRNSYKTLVSTYRGRHKPEHHNLSTVGNVCTKQNWITLFRGGERRTVEAAGKGIKHEIFTFHDLHIIIRTITCEGYKTECTGLQYPRVKQNSQAHSKHKLIPGLNELITMSSRRMGSGDIAPSLLTSAIDGGE
jgi:hypothetical protein